jgi:signal transduction histidine kinase
MLSTTRVPGDALAPTRDWRLQARRAQPRRGDVALAATVVLAGQVVVWAGLSGDQPQHGGQGVNAVLSALWLAALAWRRTTPVAAVLWYATVFCLLQPIYAHDLPVWTGFLPLVVLTVNAGYRSGPWSATAALLVSLTGLTVLTTVEPALQSWDTYIFNAAIVVPAWVAARSLARHNERARSLSADLVTLAVEQSEREAHAIAEERARIARELHDVVAHSVTVLVIQVGSARMLIDDAPERVQEQLMAAERSGREALGELRRLLGVLRPEQPDRGVDTPPIAPQPDMHDLPALAASFRDAGMNLSLHLDGATEDVGPGLALTVYRIVQEGLTNALKHAAGAEVAVRVAVLRDGVHVSVVNDNSSAPPGPGTGFGLIGLRERVALFGGTYEAGPRSGGWAITTVLPRSAEATSLARPQ